MNNRFTESWDGLGFNGVIVEIDDGKAVAVEVVREYIDFDGGVENNSTI